MNRELSKTLIAAMLTIACSFTLSAQKIAIKTNLLYGATTSPNLQLEMALNKKSTIELGFGGNWFEFGDYTKFKHILVQPEYRWWLCESFNGSFIGIHAHAAQYNVGGLDIPMSKFDNFKNHRYEGALYGAGVSYGYQWILSPRWNVEASIGAGYAYIDYNKYDCTTCGDKLDEGVYNYFGVTKAALSLIYIIK